MSSTGKSIPVDGEKIKSLRNDKRWSQEALSVKAAVCSKSIQRAEKGKKLKPEYVTQIARALSCAQSDLIANTDLATQAQEDIPAHHEQIRLKRPESAKELFKSVKTDILEFEFDVDFDEEMSEEIAALVEPLENIHVRRNDVHPPRTSEQVRTMGKLSTHLQSLENKGVCIFIGFTTYRAIYTEDEQTEYDFRYYTLGIQERSKAIILFANCQTKTRLELINIGLTYEEARNWLIEKQRENAKSNNVHVDGAAYGVTKETIGKNHEDDFDDEIPF
jgi:transcriptional regulator with XRE-family HTH domain